MIKHPESRAQRLALKRIEFERKKEEKQRPSNLWVKRERETLKDKESADELRRVRQEDPDIA